MGKISPTSPNHPSSLLFYTSFNRFISFSLKHKKSSSFSDDDSSSRKQYLIFARRSKQDLHKIPAPVKHTDNIYRLIFDSVKCRIIAANQKAVIRFKVYNRGQRCAAVGKAGKHTDSFCNLCDRTYRRLLIAKLFRNIYLCLM